VRHRQRQLGLDNFVVTRHPAAIASDVFAPTVRRMFNNIACASRGETRAGARQRRVAGSGALSLQARDATRRIPSAHPETVCRQMTI